MTDAIYLDNPSEYRRRVTSQWGEDGIVAEIFRRIGVESRFCVEFGAWDGEYLSNTWQLWHNQGWSSVLIEGDAGKAAALESKTASFDRVKVVNRLVGVHDENRLDKILADSGAPGTIDLLSIDIDGDDYHVLESCERYLPRVLIIEYNPTIPPHLDIVQKLGEYFGASALAITRLARSKGYRLVCLTQSNGIFVHSHEFHRLSIREPELSEVFPQDHLTYVITAQDGTTLLSRSPTYANLRYAKGFWRRANFNFRKRARKVQLLGNYLPIQVDIHLAEGD